MQSHFHSKNREIVSMRLNWFPCKIIYIKYIHLYYDINKRLQLCGKFALKWSKWISNSQIDNVSNVHTIWVYCFVFVCAWLSLAHSHFSRIIDNKFSVDRSRLNEWEIEISNSNWNKLWSISLSQSVQFCVHLSIYFVMLLIACCCFFIGIICSPKSINYCDICEFYCVSFLCSTVHFNFHLSSISFVFIFSSSSMLCAN